MNDCNLLNDMARLASGAAGTVFGMREELQARIRSGAERVLSNFDLVRREEFEAVRVMAETARLENEALKARLDTRDNKS